MVIDDDVEVVDFEQWFASHGRHCISTTPIVETPALLVARCGAGYLRRWRLLLASNPLAALARRRVGTVGPVKGCEMERWRYKSLPITPTDLDVVRRESVYATRRFTATIFVMLLTATVPQIVMAQRSSTWHPRLNSRS